METINTDKAPKPIGPYSQAVRAGNFLFTSGQICPDNSDCPRGIAEQTEQVLKNLINILKETGLNAQSVVKTTVYLSDMSDFDKMNEVYERYFKKIKPARSTVEVDALPGGVKIEIDLVAYSEVNKYKRGNNE